jgi:hypothetical protein
LWRELLVFLLPAGTTSSDRFLASDSAAALAASGEEECAMHKTLHTWLAERGSIVAEAVNLHGDAICERVSAHMSAMFPNLCYDPLRFDAASFQQATFRETPRRFHRLLQVALLCQSLAIVEREYQWGWKLLSRYNVERRHMLAHVRWYFEELFTLANLSGEDKLYLVELRDEMVHMIERLTITSPHQFQEPANKRYRSNGNGHNVNGRTA